MTLSTTPADRHAEATQRRRLRRELADAIRRGDLALYYQPRVTLACGGNAGDEVEGAEALARWPHRRRGLLAPGIFLPIAESGGLVAELGQWALTAACTAAAGWPVALAVSVNIAAAQLAEGHLPDQLAQALDASGLAPERLVLEFGETTLADAGLDTLLTLAAIRDLGVGLAVDRFGHGPASLSLLRRLPLSMLKLDQMLVREAAVNPQDRAILRAASEAGHALGLRVVADGVEDWAQRRMLAELGCDAAQGHLFAPALPEAAIAARLCQ